MRKNILLILAALLLVFMPSCNKPDTEKEKPVPVVDPEPEPEPEPEPTPDPDPVTVELKVMSFNVRQSHAGDSGNKAWSNRKEACLSMLQAQMPDIVGFQEAYYKDQWLYFKDNISDYDGFAVGRTDGKTSGETVGILYKKSRFKVLASGTFWLSETPSSPSVCYNDGYERTVQWAFMQILNTYKIFLYVNVHMPLKNEAQQKSLAQFIDWLKERNTQNYPVVLTGDFNMVPSSSNFSGLRKILVDSRNATYDTDNYYTYNAWGDNSKATVCDYVWISPSIQCTRYCTHRTPYKDVTFISDHYPVFSILEL